MEPTLPSRFSEPPARLKRARLDNIALVPANLLPLKETYQVLANRLPTGSVLVISGTQRQEKIMEKVRSFYREYGRSVISVPIEKITRKIKKHPQAIHAVLETISRNAILALSAQKSMSVEQTRRERFTAYAETLRARFNKGILKNMQEKPLWVLWKPEEDGQGNIHKRPYSPKDYPASIYKPRQWASLDNVLEALASARIAGVRGIGVMLPAPYVLLDKDAKPDASIYKREGKKIVSPLALRLLRQVPSYAELSPNNGLHILTEGVPIRGNFKTSELEMYTNWFSTVTTRHLPGTPLDITSQQGAIHALEDEFHPPVPERVFQNTGGFASAARLSGLPPEAQSDGLLQDLLHGDMTSVGNDHHRADWHLLMKLLHWTGDDRQLAKAHFLASPLGQRDKAQDPDGVGRRGQTNYVERTIDRILQKRRNPPQRR